MPLSHVRAGRRYVFKPNMLDVLLSRHHTCKDGDIVKVKNLYGCPPAGTMGQCHVVNPVTGQLYGMVSCNSLVPVARKEKV
jgi:hypothetical protein